MTAAAHHRASCCIHVLSRAEQRGIALDGDTLARLEAACEKLRPAFEKPGEERYWIGVKLGPQPFRALYDTRLRCFVTVWPVKKRGTRAAVLLTSPNSESSE